MRINSNYRRMREAGGAARKAGQQILSEGKERGINFGAYIRDKGQVAVQQLERADAAYAEALAGAFNTANNPMLDTMVATPLSNIRGLTPTSSYEVAGGMGPRTLQQSKAIGPMLGDAGVMAANFGARYALPGAGIALAAKGIGDVAFGGPSDQQEQGQIDMGQIAGYGALGAGVASAPIIHNAVRQESYRGMMPKGRAAAAVAGKGAAIGAGTAALLQLF